MNQEKMQELMIDYVEGRLEGELKEFIEKQIDKNDDVRAEYEVLKDGFDMLERDIVLEPDTTLKMDFDQLLEAEISRQEVPKQNDTKVISMTLVTRIAAGLLILISGTFIGWWLSGMDDQSMELAEMKKEIEKTKQMVITSLNDQNSASNRLNGVNVAYTVTDGDDDITRELIEVMNNDDNANVRMAAARALAQFKGDSLAKNALIEALSTQTDPVVQIELINIMIELKEQESIEKLQEIINDEKAIEAVKDEAHMAIFKLS